MGMAKTARKPAKPRGYVACVKLKPDDEVLVDALVAARTKSLGAAAGRAVRVTVGSLLRALVREEARRQGLLGGEVDHG